MMSFMREFVNDYKMISLYKLSPSERKGRWQPNRREDRAPLTMFLEKLLGGENLEEEVLVRVEDEVQGTRARVLRASS